MLSHKKQNSTEILASHHLTTNINISVACAKTHADNNEVLSCVLSQLVEMEERTHPARRGINTAFHASKELPISISAYIKRVVLYSKVSTEVAFQAVFHLHQLMRLPTFPLISNNLHVHRLLLTSVMTTAKYFDDIHYNNMHFAHVGGVPLEVEFLAMSVLFDVCLIDFFFSGFNRMQQLHLCSFLLSFLFALSTTLCSLTHACCRSVLHDAVVFVG
jgi:hypothetical protein